MKNTARATAVVRDEEVRGAGRAEQAARCPLQNAALMIGAFAVLQQNEADDPKRRQQLNDDNQSLQNTALPLTRSLMFSRNTRPRARDWVHSERRLTQPAGVSCTRSAPPGRSPENPSTFSDAPPISPPSISG